MDLYRQVENLYPDARDAREFLTRTGLELADTRSYVMDTADPLLDAKSRVVQAKSELLTKTLVAKFIKFINLSSRFF
ncbi:MAG: hypothetical protein HC773_26465 [Scytonema sp. CRU_2_7]|nr:hypothetical protein [Scytonema sp. CRU_2_7]